MTPKNLSENKLIHIQHLPEHRIKQLQCSKISRSGRLLHKDVHTKPWVTGQEEGPQGTGPGRGHLLHFNHSKNIKAAVYYFTRAQKLLQYS